MLQKDQTFTPEVCVESKAVKKRSAILLNAFRTQKKRKRKHKKQKLCRQKTLHFGDKNTKIHVMIFEFLDEKVQFLFINYCDGKTENLSNFTLVLFYTVM